MVHQKEAMSEDAVIPLTATRRLRQSGQAPSFLMSAAFSLCC